MDRSIAPEPDTPVGISLQESIVEDPELNPTISGDVPSGSLSSSTENSDQREHSAPSHVTPTTDLSSAQTSNLQYEPVSDNEDFEDSSQIIFLNTCDRENVGELMALDEEYSDDEESADEDVVPNNHFRKSYEFRNRPEQNAPQKSPLKKTRSQTHKSKKPFARKSSTSRNRDLPNNR